MKSSFPIAHYPCAKRGTVSAWLICKLQLLVGVSDFDSNENATLICFPGNSERELGAIARARTEYDNGGTHMKVKFPVDGAEKRLALLQAVANIKEILAAHADESETLRTLHPASVAALTDSGLFALKGPAELGGVEADPITQLEVIEATSYIDPSAGWCLSICNGGASLLGSCLPQAAIDVIYALDRSPRFAGSFTPGNAVAVSGGYRLSGRWPWASGIRHADWVAAMTVVGPDGSSPRTRE
jgi:alkylation response protein AidB-like acyl-CoA dehydrogenase